MMQEHKSQMDDLLSELETARLMHSAEVDKLREESLQQGEVNNVACHVLFFFLSSSSFSSQCQILMSRSGEVLSAGSTALHVELAVCFVN